VPALTLPLLGFVLGLAFAWASREELGRTHGRADGTRALTLVGAFGLLVQAPLTGYFLAHNPDWCFAYYVDGRALPGGTEAACVLISALAPPLGFVAGARHAGERRLGALVQLAAVPLLVAVLGTLAAFARLSIDASFAQFQGGFGTRAVAGGRLGFSLLWMAAVLVGAVAWTTVCLRKLASAPR
jgi:hypothetical protein